MRLPIGDSSTAGSAADRRSRSAKKSSRAFADAHATMISRTTCASPARRSTAGRCLASTRRPSRRHAPATPARPRVRCRQPRRGQRPFAEALPPAVSAITARTTPATVAANSRTRDEVHVDSTGTHDPSTSESAVGLIGCAITGRAATTVEASRSPRRPPSVPRSPTPRWTVPGRRRAASWWRRAGRRAASARAAPTGHCHR